jgi:hypothetical protein
MSTLARQVFGEDVPLKPLGLIVDLDETICTSLAIPIRQAIDVLLRLDRRKVEVHYVTARTEVSRPVTQRFMDEHRLPGWKNLHFCPNWQSSKRHKVETHARLAREHHLIASIGDTHEEEGEAALLAGITFVLVERRNPGPAWKTLEQMIAVMDGFGKDAVA